jgi:hypothetical protein
MVDAAHLRELARQCLWLSKNCYDLTAAAELRRISTEMNAEAESSQKLSGTMPLPH